MENSKLVYLKSTSNPNYAYLIGKEGELSLGEDGIFKFRFKDSFGELKILKSGVVGGLGDLNHPASKEICYQTKHSVYVFEKKEKEMGLFAFEHDELSSPAEMSYEEYNSLKKTVEGLHKGDNQRLTLQEQRAVLKKWEKVNKDIKEGKTTVFFPKKRNNISTER